MAQVLIAEADAFVAMWKDETLPDGRDRIVRHGHRPPRAIQTGSALSKSVAPRVRDRGDVGTEEKIRFSSAIPPKWAGRAKSLDALLPVLYLRGVSTGDFQDALAALLGKDAPNLLPAVISPPLFTDDEFLYKKTAVKCHTNAGAIRQAKAVIAPKIEIDWSRSPLLFCPSISGCKIPAVIRKGHICDASAYPPGW